MPSSPDVAESPADVAVVLSHLVGLDTARLYVDALLHVGGSARVYCLGDFHAEAREALPAVVDVVPRSAIRIPRRRSRVLAQFIYLFTDFDAGLNRDQRQQFHHRSAVGRAVRRGALVACRQLSATTTNRFLQRIGRMMQPVLPERRIWVVSFLTEPLVAIAGKPQICTLIDSWDHPVRKPAGYVSDFVVGWNQDIADDWQNFQGARVAISGAPAKLRYAAESDQLSSTQERVLLYAVGTSSHTPEWEQAELAFAKLLCEAAGRAGWRVVIKCKPTGGQEAWHSFASTRPEVSLTNEPDAINPMHYRLDDRYNQARLREMSQAALVVNTVTTFGLDAACAGIPVLQVRIGEGAALAALRSAQRNYHLAHHLLADDDALDVDQAHALDQLQAWLASPDDRAVRHTRRLRAWLVPDVGFDEAARRAVAPTIDASAVASPPSA